MWCGDFHVLLLPPSPCIAISDFLFTFLLLAVSLEVTVYSMENMATNLQ